MSQSLREFEKVKWAFYHQYAFRWELRRNNNDLLKIKMKPEESLKQCINYF